MAFPANRPLEAAVDIIVYEGATHGEHAGKLNALLVTENGDVYGIGTNTLVTCAVYSGDYPMQEGSSVYFMSWTKVHVLCGLNIRKIIVSLGFGAAITNHNELLIWGKGASTYIDNSGFTILQVFRRGIECALCNSLRSTFARKVGKTMLLYCNSCRKHSAYSADTPPLEGVPVKRLGNRKYGPLTCSECMEDCDPEMMDGFELNFCHNCNKLWDLDENSRPMNLMSTPVGSFVHKLDCSEKILDVAPGIWGFWVLTDANHILWSEFFAHSNSSDVPTWWKLSLSSKVETIISVHSNKTDVFAVTSNGALYKRVVSGNRGEAHSLKRILLKAAVKKLCCGRLASVCLLEDGTIWILYNGLNCPKKLIEASGGFDVCAAAYSDLFYVQANRFQDYVVKEHPLKDSTIKIFLGTLDFINFIQFFFSRFCVPSDGFSFHESAVCQLSMQDRKHSKAMPLGSATTFFLDKTKHLHPEFNDLKETTMNDGQGSASGASFMESSMVGWASRGFGWIRDMSTYVYQATRSRIERTLAHQHTSAGQSTSVHLPPFLSGLYGKPLFADLTLQMSDGGFPAHRTVLCSTSAYFREKLTACTETTTLDVRVYNPRAYRGLLKHLYQLEPDDLVVDDMLDLLLLATSYEETGIAKDAAEKLKSKINANNVAMIMDVCRNSGFTSLENECEIFMRSDPAFKEMLLSLAIKKLPTLVNSNGSGRD